MPMATHECPARLYKYFNSDRINVLESALVRYSPLGSFNDPFEGRPDVTDITTRADARKRLEELAPTHIEEAYQRLSQEQRALLPSKETFESTILENLHANQEGFYQNLRNLTPHVKDVLKQNFDAYIGAFCLSEVPDSILMWSHYGASHTGFVIEFDAHHQYFHDRRSDEDELRFLRRVLYRDNRPRSPLNLLNAPEFFLIKSSHWSYEREWRILRSLTDAVKTLPGSPYPVHLFPLPLDTITAIIIGARMPQDAENRLRIALRAIVDRRDDIKLMRAIPDESHFVLRLEEEKP